MYMHVCMYYNVYTILLPHEHTSHNDFDYLPYMHVKWQLRPHDPNHKLQTKDSRYKFDNPSLQAKIHATGRVADNNNSAFHIPKTCSRRQIFTSKPKTNVF